MAKINIPFNDWSKEKLALGTKACTSRSQKYGNAGDEFFVELPAKDSRGNDTKKFQRYELLGVVKLPLSYIFYNLYEAEGASDSDELMNVWGGIHPRFEYEKDRDKGYFVHFFKEVNE